MTFFSSYSVWMLDDFKAMRFSLSNIIVQLSLHICLSEMSEDDFNAGRNVASVTLLEIFLESGSVPFYKGSIKSPSGKVTDEPLYGFTLDRN